MNETHERREGLFAAEGNPAEAFEAIEEVLDQTAFGIESAVERAGACPRRVRRDLRLRPQPVTDEVPEWSAS